MRRYEVCPSCGFTKLKNEFYLSADAEKKRYLLHTNSREDAGYVQWLSAFLHKARLLELTPDACILDFGSGPQPVLASLLQERGYKVSIYDQFFAPDPIVLRCSYSVIVLHEVIEHLADPRECLAALLEALAPHGYFAIRTQFRPPTDTDFDAFWYRKDLTHRSFFTKLSFATLAQQLGLAMSQPATDIVLLQKQ